MWVPRDLLAASIRARRTSESAVSNDVSSLSLRSMPSSIGDVGGDGRILSKFVSPPSGAAPSLADGGGSLRLPPFPSFLAFGVSSGIFSLTITLDALLFVGIIRGSTQEMVPAK